MSEDQITPTTPEPIVATPEVSTPPVSSDQWAQAYRDSQVGEEPQPIRTPSPEAAPAESVPPAPASTENVEEPAAPATVRLTPSAPAVADNLPVAWEKISNGQVKDETEFQSILSEYQTLKENPVTALPPAEQKLLQLHRSGQDVMEYLQFQNTDFAKMDAMDVLRFQWQQDNKEVPPHLTERGWNKYLKDKYPNLEAFGENEEDSEWDKFQLTKQAESTRQQLLTKQQEMAIPASEPATGKAGTAPEAQPLTEAQQADILQQVEKASSFRSLTVDVQVGNETKPVELPFSPTPEFNEAVYNPGQFMVQRWKNADGSENYPQIALDLAMILNGQNFINEAHAKGAKVGTTQVREVLENPEPLVSNTPPSTQQDRAGLVAAARMATQNNQQVSNGRHTLVDW